MSAGRGLHAIEAWRGAAAALADGALSDEPLRGAIAAGAMARLRAGHGAEVVSAAVDLVRARDKLGAKWPRLGIDAWIEDVAGAEMASSRAIAQHKASRFAVAAHVLDLCSGVGADARAGRGLGCHRVRG